MMRVLALLVLVWLIVGAVAAGQRGYFTHAAQNCASAGTIAVTVIAGPLNYVGVNPKVTNCHVPQPSS
jgi:membrane protein YdbS with pleckstrin-like domain